MTRKLTLFTVCAFEIALILFVAAWTAWAGLIPVEEKLEEAKQIRMENIMAGGVGLAYEKEGNTNRKVYRSFFKISQDRSIVANIEFRNDKPEISSLTDALVLPEFIEWGKFRLNRKTLLLTNLAISPRRQECVAVSYDELIERAKLHLAELQEGNKL